MKKFVLASLFVVAAAALQPALAAGAGGPAHMYAKGELLCACGKLPGAMFQCCHAKNQGKVRLFGRGPELQVSIKMRSAQAAASFRAAE